MSTSIFAASLKSLKPYVQYIPNLSKPILRVIIQFCVLHLENENCTKEVLEKALVKVKNNGQEIPEHFCELFTAVLILLKHFLRSPKANFKDDEVLREFLRELKFQNECIEDLCNVLNNHKDLLTLKYMDSRCFDSRPKRITWRINLTNMDNATRLNQPTIILHILTTENKTKTLELSISMFHRVRYNIAALLNELQIIENRQIMKK